MLKNIIGNVKKGFNDKKLAHRRQQALETLKLEKFDSVATYKNLSFFESDNYIFGKLGIENIPTLVTIVVNNNPVCITNSLFQAMPDKVKTTYYAIEHSHIVMGHYGYIANPDVLSLAMNADAKAYVDVGIDVIYALSYVRDNYELSQDKVEEINQRIYGLNTLINLSA